MFLVSAFAALYERPNRFVAKDGTLYGTMTASWLFVGVVLTILAGFRFEVGGDWYHYVRHFNLMIIETWENAAKRPEFSHWLVNKLMSQLGLGLTGVNVFYAFIFAIGLIAFLKTLPRPWLALTAAVPYLIIVVSMGYSRQAVALGLIMLGIVYLRRGRFYVFAIVVLLGATFHSSAVLLLPIAGLATKRNRWQALAAAALFGGIGYEVLLAERFDNLVNIYVDQKLVESQGALIRLFMNLLPALLFLLLQKNIAISDQERRLWTLMSLISIAMWAAYFVTGLSTALDRIALYMIPIQLFVAAHFPDALGKSGGSKGGGVLLVLGYYATVQFVWLNFASHAPYWLPYRMGFSG